MKLVSDFDGVWTYPEDEARAQGEVLEATLLSTLPESDRAQGEAWLRAARASTRRSPTAYGWAPGGRISAFADEDPFALQSALLHYLHLHASEDPLATAMHEGVLARFKSLDALGGHSHAEGVKQVAETRGPGILPASAEAGKRLLGAGVEVVVVSNSGTDKLVRWFDHAGVPNVVHPESRPGALRLRGSARKFVLDEQRSDPIEIGEIEIETARPAYEAVLRDEVPDGVVGDVFSLDLALPLALKRRDPSFAKLRLFWLLQPYTPPWLREAVIAAAPREVELVQGGLAGVARRIMDARKRS